MILVYTGLTIKVTIIWTRRKKDRESGPEDTPPKKESDYERNALFLPGKKQSTSDSGMYDL